MTFLPNIAILMPWWQDVELRHLSIPLSINDSTKEELQLYDIKCHNKLEKGDILEEKRRFSLEEKNIMFFMKQ